MTSAGKKQWGWNEEYDGFTRSGRTQWTRSFSLRALVLSLVITPNLLLADVSVFGVLVDGGSRRVYLGDFGRRERRDLVVRGDLSRHGQNSKGFGGLRPRRLLIELLSAPLLRPHSPSL
jgi:hypothetical protein